MDLADNGAAVIFKDHESEIASYVKGLVESTTDVNIICGTTIIRAHRSILGASSNHLLGMFLLKPNASFNFIMDEQVNPKDVDNLLNYIYKGGVSVKSPKRTLGFLRAAKELRIDDLMETAETRLATAEANLNSKESKTGETSSKKANAGGTNDLVQTDAVSSITFRNSKVNHEGVGKVNVPKAEVEDKDDNSNFKVPSVISKEKAKLLAKRKRPDAKLTKLKPEPGLGKEDILTDSNFKQIAPNVNVNVNAKSSEGSLAHLRQKIGRPILSSTKLYPKNPRIPDKLKKLPEKVRKDQRAKAFLVETPTGTEEEESNKENKTFVVKNKIEEGRKVSRKEPLGIVNGNKEDPVSKQGMFSLAELIEEMDKKQETKTSQLEESTASDLATSEIFTKPATSDTSAKSGDNRFAVLSILKNNLKRRYTKVLRTTVNQTCGKNGHGRTKIGRFETNPISKKNLLKGTDDSSDALEIVGKVKKKIPVGKRRRIPASTRPLIASTTTSASASCVRCSSRRRNNFRNKIGRRVPEFKPNIL